MPKSDSTTRVARARVRLSRAGLHLVQAADGTVDLRAGTLAAGELGDLIAETLDAANRRRVRPGRRRLSAALLAREMLDYASWVDQPGRTVAGWCAARSIPASTLENHRRRAIELGLFEGLGHGNPGGKVTAAGIRAIKEGTE